MIYESCKICGNKTFEFLPKFELLKCASCEIIFYKHRLDSVYVKDLYNKLYNQEDDYSQYKRQAKELLSGIQPHLGYNKNKILNAIINKGCKNFLEVGAGVGVVGYYLQKKKFSYDGIELDKEAAQLAKDAGIHVVNESIHYLSHFNNKDALLSFEVMEHIDDLKTAFTCINQSLKTGGYFGFSVPNFERLYNLPENMRDKSLGQVGPPVHINFFTVKNLEKILPQFGFEILYLKARPFPSLNWKNKSTYKKLFLSLQGKYHGATILCLARKSKEILN
jgi:SAM-dependent methyltransferase